MIDLLVNEVHVGDKVAYVNKIENRDGQNLLQYGMVVKISNNGNACWCKSISEPQSKEILRYNNQIIKLL